MIEDARVLKDEFLPTEIEHRNAELNELSAALDPILEGNPASTSFLVGPTGSGKTCLARYTLEELREAVLDINTQYVNCWQDYNRYRVLYRLLDGLNRTVDIHRQSTPKDELFSRLEHADDHPYVVILDEVDQLEDQRVLYDLYTLPHVSLILIANTEAELFATLDDRLQSRLHSAARIRFDRYDIRELVSILDARARWGLAPDTVTTSHLEQIADAAAGDARIAIGILREAARRASERGHTTLTANLITDAIPQARAQLKRNTLDRLSEHQRVLYDIIQSEATIAPGDLYAQYQAAVDDPKTRRTVRNYLSKMDHYDLIDAIGENRGRIYQLA